MRGPIASSSPLMFANNFLVFLPITILLLLFGIKATEGQGNTLTGVCGYGNPCQNGACCAVAPEDQTGYCGYGPDYCTNNALTNCVSNCNATAACGNFSVPKGQECPLKVCCSQWGFCGTTDDFCSTANKCQSNCGTPKNPNTGCATGTTVKQRVIGYYLGSASQLSCNARKPSDIPAQYYTHLYYAFATINPADNGIGPMYDYDKAQYVEFNNLKKVHAGLKTAISIGGWDFSDPDQPTHQTWSKLAASDSSITFFINTLINFLYEYGFDGVDFDWEYPVASDRGGSPDDTKNYVNLLKAVRERWVSTGNLDWTVTFTAPSSYWYLQNFDVPSMLKYADYVGMMEYDLHGTWDRTDQWIGPYLLAHTNITEMQASLNLLWRNGIDSDQVVLGMGFYGRSFTLQDVSCSTPGYTCTFASAGDPGECTKNAGTLSYAEIMDTIRNENVVSKVDVISGAEILTWGNQWVSYDDNATFPIKLKFADDNCLAGIMIWSVDNDDEENTAITSLLSQDANDALDDLNTLEFGTNTNCAVTTCGGSCPTGYVQQIDKASGKPASYSDGCSGGQVHKICCPVEDQPKSCQWRGTADQMTQCMDGYCQFGEQTVTVSLSGNTDGSCAAPRHKEFCCISNEMSEYNDDCVPVPIVGTTTADNACSVVGNLGIGSYPYKFTEIYGASYLGLAQTSFSMVICCQSKAPFTGCEWRGATSDGCYGPDTLCLENQFVYTVATCGGNQNDCCPYGIRKSYCCNLPGYDSDGSIPLDDIFDNPPADGDEIYSLKILDLVDQSDDTNPNKNPFGSMYLDGDEADVAPLGASNFVVTGCTSDEVAQQVKIFCRNDWNTSDCSRLTAVHTVDTFIKLPSSCSGGNFARLSYLGVSEDQTLSSSLDAVKPTTELVYDLHFDYDFELMNDDQLSNDIIYRLDTSNIDGYWDSVVDSAPSKTKRELGVEGRKKRWWGALSDWLKKTTTLDTSSSNFIDIAGPKVLNYPIVNAAYHCPSINLDMTVKIGITGTVSIPITYGYYASGHLLPLPSGIDEAYGYINAQAKAELQFYAYGAAQLTWSPSRVNILSIPVLGFSFPGIATVGPALNLDAYMKGQVKLEGTFVAGFSYNSPAFRFTLPESSGEGATGNVPTAPAVQPVLEASVSAAGSLEAHIIPGAFLGVKLSFRSITVVEASAVVEADAYGVIGFTAEYGTSQSNACIYAEAGVDVIGRVSGTLNLLKTWSGAATYPFYSGDPINLYQYPANCRTSKKREYDDELYDSLPAFNWTQVLGFPIDSSYDLVKSNPTPLAWLALEKRDGETSSSAGNPCPPGFDCKGDGAGDDGADTGFQDADCQEGTFQTCTQFMAAEDDPWDSKKRSISPADSSQGFDTDVNWDNFDLPINSTAWDEEDDFSDLFDGPEELLHYFEERDTYGGSGGARKVNQCNTALRYPALKRAGLVWYDYTGDFFSASGAIDPTLKGYNPSSDGTVTYNIINGPNVVAPGKKYPDGRPSYYDVEHVFEIGWTNLFLGTLDVNTRIVVCTGLNSGGTGLANIKSAITSTNNLAVAPSPLNLYKEKAFASGGIGGPGVINDQFKMLRRIKYFRAIANYMSQSAVQTQLLTTAKAVQTEMVNALGKGANSGAVAMMTASQVQTAFKNFMINKINSGATWINGAVQQYANAINSAGSTPYGVAASTLLNLSPVTISHQLGNLPG